MYNHFLQEFSGTWSLFCSVPLPSFLRGDDEISKETPAVVENVPELARPLLPLVGFTLSVPAFLCVWLLETIFNRSTAVIAAGLILPLLLEFVCGWRGLLALGAYIRMRKDGASLEEALSVNPAAPDAVQTPNALILFISIYLMRAAMFAALAIFSGAFWYVIVFVGAYLVRAELSSVKNPLSGRELLETPERYRKLHWPLAAGAMFLLSLSAFSHIAGALTGLLFTWLLSWYFSQLALQTERGVNGNALNLFGYASEMLLLLLGVFLFCGN